MSEDIRQFVYLNSQSVNSLLASMFMAVPQTVREVAEESESSGDETTGEAGFKLGSLLNIGGSRSRSSTETDRQRSEVENKITDQYRFSILIRALEEDGDQVVHDVSTAEDVSNLESGDIVRVNGTCKTDPLYPLLGALEHITEATSEAPSGDGLMAQLIKSQSDLGQVEQFYKLIYGGWVGLELNPDIGEYRFGFALDEDQTWVNGYREFRGVNEYTVLGRVQENVSEGEVWDLIEALRVVNGVTSDDSAHMNRANLVAKTLDAMDENEQSEDFELPDLEPDDFILEGPAMTLDPIAVYW